MTEAEAQAALVEVVGDLLAIQDRLRRIASDLPRSPGREEMFEHRRPYDVATDLLATIEAVAADPLRSAIQALERASRVTDEELRREFGEG